jgi:tungstate transport system substrate-binding protein
MMRNGLILLALMMVLAACAESEPTTTGEAQDADTAAENRLTVVTSITDAGLFERILPDFEAQFSATVNVVVVDTTQVLSRGRNGDVDVLLITASQAEAFAADGDGTQSTAVMTEDMVIVGPESDMAGLTGRGNASLAFTLIADAGMTFISRGDNSIVHATEQAIWQESGISPDGQFWYQSTGQRMDAVLSEASEQQAYTLVDRATFVQRGDLDLMILVQGDTSLQVVYHVIPVSPAEYPNVNAALAQQFADWIMSEATQAAIGTYTVGGQAIFSPVMP